MRVDARVEPRTKPMLNTGGRKLNDIVELFYFFLPPQWVADIMKYTNPLLDEHDALHAKLTEGEVPRFFGYMLSLSLHTGVPLEKMWSKTQDPSSTTPPPMMPCKRWAQSLRRAVQILLPPGFLGLKAPWFWVIAIRST